MQINKYLCEQLCLSAVFHIAHRTIVGLATFAFGIGTPSKSPEVNLRFTATDTAAGQILKVSHEGGDVLILKT